MSQMPPNSPDVPPAQPPGPPGPPPSSPVPPSPPMPPGPPGPGVPGQQPPPGWGAPPPSSGAGGSKTLLMVLVGLLALAGVGTVAFFLIKDDDDSGGGGGGGNSPEATVRAIFEATEPSDCGNLLDLVTEQSWALMFGSGEDLDIGNLDDAPSLSRDEALEECKANIEDNSTDDETLLSVKVLSEDGNKATVEAKTETDGDEATTELPVVKQDGKWKLDFKSFLEEQFGDLGDIESQFEDELDIDSETETTTDG